MTSFESFKRYLFLQDKILHSCHLRPPPLSRCPGYCPLLYWCIGGWKKLCYDVHADDDFHHEDDRVLVIIVLVCIGGWKSMVVMKKMMMMMKKDNDDVDDFDADCT